MNEISRIHIAKVPYDIEIGAKKEIEKYVGDLEAYSDDKELLQDIEIRITELLEIRGVRSNGVITHDDIVAIREQLGEPREFMGESDASLSPEMELSGDATRKLYRNTDSAVFGGVLSGVASFFRINPLWIRLIFIILMFASAGAVVLVYVLLWIALPPARTAAEKLQMAGRPVTLGSIRELNEDQSGLAEHYRRAEMVRRSGIIALGILSTLAAVGAVIATVGAGISLPLLKASILVDADWPLIAAFVLAMVSGLLLASLFSIGAYAAFARKFTKRLLVSVIGIVVAGIVAFGAAIGLVGYQSWLITSQIRENTISVPGDFSNVKTLVVETGVGTHVEYIIDDSPRMTLRSLPEENQPIISVNGATATLRFAPSSGVRLSHGPVLLRVYGPALDSLIAKNSTVNVLAGTSASLSIETIGNGSSVSLEGGVFDRLRLKAGGQTMISASYASVATGEVDMHSDSHVSLGTVKSLSVTQPSSCPSSQSTQLNVEAVTSGVFAYNGESQVAKTYDSHCGRVVVGADEQRSSYHSQNGNERFGDNHNN